MRLGEENKQLMDLFTLYHEAGHALTASFLMSERIVQKECTADAYAALRMLQRFGNDAVPLLSMISGLRASEAIAKDSSHLTTTVLDKIILDSAHVDFSKLTHAETVQLAKNYAKTLTPKARTLARADTIFKQEDALADPSSRMDDFSFYILAKAAQPIKQNDVRTAIEMRLSTMHLHDVFNTKAPFPETAGSLAEALKIKPFVFGMS